MFLWLHEEIDFWLIHEGINIVPRNTFMGVGYNRRVRQAITKADHTLAEPNPPNQVKFDATVNDLHEETGYIIAFTNTQGEVNLQKFLTFPRGQTVRVDGTWDQSTYSMNV